MALFKNKETDETGMAAEVHQIYQSEHRERVGVAWLLAFVTLVLTVGIALGGFTGGRAIYRKVTKKNKSTTRFLNNITCVANAPAFSSAFNSTFGNFETAITMTINKQIAANNQYTETQGRSVGTMP